MIDGTDRDDLMGLMFALCVLLDDRDGDDGRDNGDGVDDGMV